MEERWTPARLTRIPRRSFLCEIKVVEFAIIYHFFRYVEYLLEFKAQTLHIYDKAILIRNSVRDSRQSFWKCPAPTTKVSDVCVLYHIIARPRRTKEIKLSLLSKLNLLLVCVFKEKHLTLT